MAVLLEEPSFTQEAEALGHAAAASCRHQQVTSGSAETLLSFNKAMAMLQSGHGVADIHLSFSCLPAQPYPSAGNPPNARLVDLINIQCRTQLDVILTLILCIPFSLSMIGCTSYTGRRHAHLKPAAICCAYLQACTVQAGTACLPQMVVCASCRTQRMLLGAFSAFKSNHAEAHSLRCAMHAVKRVFTAWQHTVQARVADYHGTFSLARTRRRLRLQGWTSEQRWHQLHSERRSPPAAQSCILTLQFNCATCAMQGQRIQLYLNSVQLTERALGQLACCWLTCSQGSVVKPAGRLREHSALRHCWDNAVC